MLLMRPCETVLRKILPYSIPGRRRLCTYSARPVTLSQDSRRGTARPTCPVSAGWLARFIDRSLQVDADELLLVGRRAVQIAFYMQLLHRVGGREPGRPVGRGAHEESCLFPKADRDAHGGP